MNVKMKNEKLKTEMNTKKDDDGESDSDISNVL
jgi:hypothetical protein